MMRPTTRSLPLFGLLTTLMACGPGPSPWGPDAARDAVATDASADGSADAGTSVRCSPMFGSTVCRAVVLASVASPGATDVRPSGMTFRHAYCFPVGASFNGKLVLYLSGTLENPEVQSDFATRACSLGFAAVALSYPNEVDSRTACTSNSACYENFRREIVYGQDVAPDPIRVNQTNSILGRFLGVMAYLAERERYFPAWASLHERVAMRDFSQVVVAGHSQGAGHALYIAREFPVERVIMLGGVTDRVNSGLSNNMAPAWIASWSNMTSRTSSSRFFGFNHQDDGVAIYRQVLSNYDSLMLPAAECDFLEAGAYPMGCHRVRVPTARCGGSDAHNAVMLGTFGDASNACAAGGTVHHNDLTFAYLLNAPL